MLALGKANLQDMLAMPLSSILVTKTLPHFPLAQVNLFPEKPKSIVPNSTIRSLR